MSEIKEWFPGKKVPSDKRPFVSKLSPRKSSGMSCPGALKSIKSSFSSWPDPRSSGDKAAIPKKPAQLSKKLRRSLIEGRGLNSTASCPLSRSFNRATQAQSVAAAYLSRLAICGMIIRWDVAACIDHHCSGYRLCIRVRRLPAKISKNQTVR
jgi:hypothetical protein